MVSNMSLSESLKTKLIDILRELVQIPTENPPGKTESVVNFLVNQVFKKEEGFHNAIITHTKNDIRLHNLISRIGSGKKKIILSGHFDVVPAGDLSKWTYPPFSGRIVNGKLYGRGSADMKGGIVSLIGVLKSLSKEVKFLENYELIFLGTADEEAGMSGSFTLANTKILEDAIFLIVAEPTNLNIGIAEKGMLWIKLKIHGKSAHGSMPQEGKNAIEGALKILPQLYTCLEDKEDPILGFPTLNVGKINGGTKINVVPDYAELELDFRYIPEQKPEDIINKVKSLKLDSFNIEVEIIKRQPAIETDLNYSFIKNLKKLSNSEEIGLPYATDASNYITPNNQIPFVIFGPGDHKAIHNVNESVSLDQVFKAAEFLTATLLETYLK
jgi:succinyl-diaminopimelate desuccinylase